MCGPGEEKERATKRGSLARVRFVARHPDCMQILRPLVVAVDDLRDLAERPPSIESCRPAFCPGCGQLARHEDGRLAVVGHGLYWRQVLGVEPGGEIVEIPVRRFLCERCEQTTSVLPDVLHPGRWYAAGLIVEALRLWLIAAISELDVRRAVGLPVDEGAIWWSWRSLRRWRRQILDRLWGWLGPRLGARGPARDREIARQRVTRMFREACEAVRVAASGWSVARRLLESVTVGVKARTRPGSSGM